MDMAIGGSQETPVIQIGKQCLLDTVQKYTFGDHEPVASCITNWWNPVRQGALKYEALEYHS